MPAEPTYEQLLQRVRELEGVEADFKNAQGALAERVKELRCLHAMARIVETPGISVHEILQGVADIIPPSWHYPRATCARVHFEGHDYRTAGFRETEHRQRADLLVNGKKAGFIQVCRTNDPGDSTEPFFREEQTLLDMIAERLGRVIERLRAQETLRESEEKFRGFFMNSLDAVLITSPNGAIETANPSACELFGMPEDELVAAGREAVVDTSDPRLSAALEQRRRNGYFHGQLTFKRKDGSVFPGEVSSVVYRDQHQELQTAMIIRDRSETNRIIEELEDAKALLQTAMDNSQAGIAIADAPDGTLRYVNNAGLMIRGASAQDVVNGVGVDEYVSSWRILDLDGTPLERDEVPLARALLYGEKNSREFIVQRSDEEDRVVWGNAAPVFGKNGDVVAAIVIFLDITERKAAEQELRDREHHLAAILNTTVDGFWVLDATGRITRVNDAYCRMSGYSREELIGMHIGQLDTTDTDEARSARIERIIEHGSETFETNHRRKDGALLPVEMSVSCMQEPDRRFACFCRDISERKKAEEALTRTAEALNKAQRVSHVGSWEWDITNSHLEWSDEMYRIFGIDRDDFPGTLPDVIARSIHPEDRQAVDASNQSVIEHKKPIPLEYRVIRPDGDVRTVWAEAGELVLDEDGCPARLNGIVMDITERKNNERQLEIAATKYKTLFDCFPQGITVSDDKGNIIEANQISERILGVSVQQHKERDIDGPEWRIIRPDGRPLQHEEYASVRALRENRPVTNSEMGIVKPNGDVTWINVNATPLPLPGYGVVITYADITETKQAEEEREALRRQLDQAQKLESVGRLAGGVAHDFNNMLSVIYGNAELLLSDLDPADPTYHSVQEIQSAAQRSADLTRQLLAFARKQTVAPKVLDLNETIKSMTKMLERLIGENIDLLYKPGTSLYPVRIDPTQIDQILANLLVNARDAIEGDVGKVTIETENADIDEEYCSHHSGFVPGRYVMFAVSDNGCGIAEEVRANIFEPFFSTKEQHEGTGLGLATVYGIVKQNDGFINTYSEPGVGTTFRIYLPAYQKDATGTPQQTAPASLEAGTETILMVEDEPAIRSVGVAMLERLGYHVIAAATPGEAVSAAREHKGTIDLLVTDVVMPEMNGRELAKRLLSIYPGLKRLFMSGYTANVIAHHGVLEEGINFIQKPFSLHDLSRKVREALR